MSTILTIVARIEAKADKVELVKTALLKLIEPTLVEDGCLQYDLHHDLENPELFLVFENWQSRAAWEAHMNNASLKNFMQETDGKLTSFTANQMSKVA